MALENLVIWGFKWIKRNLLKWKSILSEAISKFIRTFCESKTVFKRNASTFFCSSLFASHSERFYLTSDDFNRLWITLTNLHLFLSTSTCLKVFCQLCCLLTEVLLKSFAYLISLDFTGSVYCSEVFSPVI